jgi:hypothetical protein
VFATAFTLRDRIICVEGQKRLERVPMPGRALIGREAGKNAQATLGDARLRDPLAKAETFRCLDASTQGTDESLVVRRSVEVDYP